MLSPGYCDSDDPADARARIVVRYRPAGHLKSQARETGPEVNTPYLQPRYYRAPEVIIGRAPTAPTRGPLWDSLSEYAASLSPIGDRA